MVECLKQNIYFSFPSVYNLPKYVRSAENALKWEICSAFDTILGSELPPYTTPLFDCFWSSPINIWHKDKWKNA